jgi:hypothetical protein
MMTTAAHTEYLRWSAQAVRQANLAWRARRPYRGEAIMSRAGLHSFLFRWAVETGRVQNPGPARSRSESVYVAAVFKDEPEAVKETARIYWKILVRQHA